MQSIVSNYCLEKLKDTFDIENTKKIENALSFVGVMNKKRKNKKVFERQSSKSPTKLNAKLKLKKEISEDSIIYSEEGGKRDFDLSHLIINGNDENKESTFKPHKLKKDTSFFGIGSENTLSDDEGKQSIKMMSSSKVKPKMDNIKTFNHDSEQFQSPVKNQDTNINFRGYTLKAINESIEHQDSNDIKEEKSLSVSKLKSPIEKRKRLNSDIKDGSKRIHIAIESPDMSHQIKDVGCMKRTVLLI